MFYRLAGRGDRMNKNTEQKQEQKRKCCNCKFIVWDFFNLFCNIDGRCAGTSNDHVCDRHRFKDEVTE